MKITHLSTYPVGGAAIAGRRLHEGLIKIGVDSRFYTLHAGGDGIDNHVVYEHRPDLWQNVSARLKKGRLARQDAVKHALPKRFDWFSFSDSGLFAENADVVRDADVLILHWTSDWLNWPSFFKAVADKPVILLMHDMNHVTGGCHYSLGCEQFTTTCRTCPQVEGLRVDDLVMRTFEAKLVILQNQINLIATMPSAWMAENARRSRALKGRQIQKVNYGLDTTLFLRKPRPSSEETVIGFVADSVANERKGFRLLLEALDQVDNKEHKIKIKVMGAHGEGFDNLKHPMEFLGRVSGDENLAAFYNSIDLFVIPSSYDNQPNTVIEALCCGVPVVGFPGSGVAEMVRPGMSGVIAHTFSSAALATAIEQALEEMGRYDRDTISQDAHTTYDYTRMASEYKALSEKLLTGSH